MVLRALSKHFFSCKKTKKQQETQGLKFNKMWKIMSFNNLINFKENLFILIKFGTKNTFLWLEGPLGKFGSLAADGLKSHIRWTGLVIWAWICFILLWVRFIMWLLTFQILSVNQVRLTQPNISLSNRFPNPSLSPIPATAPPTVVLSFLSLTDTDTKGCGFLFNHHPSTNPPISLFENFKPQG